MPIYWSHIEHTHAFTARAHHRHVPTASNAAKSNVPNIITARAVRTVSTDSIAAAAKLTQLRRGVCMVIGGTARAVSLSLCVSVNNCIVFMANDRNASTLIRPDTKTPHHNHTTPFPPTLAPCVTKHQIQIYEL